MESLQADIKIITINDLKNEVFNGKFDDPNKYLLEGEAKILFTENPYALENDPVQALAILEDRIVGRINLFRGQIKQNDENHDIFWTSGFAVDENLRGKGIGKKLILSVQNLSEIFGALGASAMSFPIFKKMGWYLCEAPRIVFIKNSLPIIRSRLKHKRFSVLISALLNIVFKIYYRFCSVFVRVPTNFHVDEIPNYNGLPLPGMQNENLTFPHSPEWFSWVHNTVTIDNSNKWQYFVVESDKKPFGYFILSTKFYKKASRWGYKDMRLTTVKDWQAVDGSKKSQRIVARLSIEQAMNLPADAIQICSNDDLLMRELKKRGGIMKGSMPLFIASKEKSPIKKILLENPSIWNFRAIDGDYFLF